MRDADERLGEPTGYIVHSTFLILSGLGYPEYSSPKSKRTYSDHAKASLLAVKESLGKSFAEFSRMLPSLTGVMNAAGISDIPEETTLRKFRKRPDLKILDGVLAVQSMMIIGNSSLTVAVDATDMSASHASRHYVRLRYVRSLSKVSRSYEHR